MKIIINKQYKMLKKLSHNSYIKQTNDYVAIINTIQSQIDLFLTYSDIIEALINPGMKQRHWDMLLADIDLKDQLIINKTDQVKEEAQQEEEAQEEEDQQEQSKITLDLLINKHQFLKYKTSIVKIGDKAAKEYQIEVLLNKMEAAWSEITLEIISYKSTQTYIVKSVDEIMTLLDEHIVMSQGMQFSAYKKPFEERINKWCHKLQMVQEVLEEWLQVQSKWMSLQSIFSSADINKQLPTEGKRFSSVNKSWRLIMSQVQANPDVLHFCNNLALLKKLKANNYILQSIQKRLTDYLDTKRAIFTRFYFLANKELLDILSQTQEVKAVQPHLKKTFDNINELKFITKKEQSKTLSLKEAEEAEEAEVQVVENDEKEIKEPELLIAGMYSLEGEYI